jgi:hypothetical protein
MYGEPCMWPFIPDSIFQAASVNAFLWHETGETEFWDAIGLLRKCLELFGKRWGVSGECLEGGYGMGCG